MIQDFLFLGGFAIVAVASFQISRLFLNLKLPLITGFLITGLLAGPYVFRMIPAEAPPRLDFLNDLSLAFIAFAAGTELFLKELRSRLKSIAWNTFGQLLITFLLGGGAVYFLADQIPFMQEMSSEVRLAVAILAGTIFVARSPASAIAIINEMRARGPFTQTALGVTVVKDILVIILFTICFSLSHTFVEGTDFNALELVKLLGELLFSFGMGYVLGKILQLIFDHLGNTLVKTTLILSLGFGVYLLSHFLRHWSEENFHFEFYMEPLLICILASFYITNFTSHRKEMAKIMHDAGPMIYTIFFTLTGAAMSLDVLAEVWLIALILFGVRIVSMMIASFAGGVLAGDPPLYRWIGWMPYVTQAGVGLGLATLVKNEYPEWGGEFATIIIAVIVLNQIVGPPLFKLSINMVKESHAKAATPAFDGERDAIIFGGSSQSLALAAELKRKGWGVQVASKGPVSDELNQIGIPIKHFKEWNLEALKSLKAGKTEAIVTMLNDKENREVCEIAFENFGTKDLIVVLNERANIESFAEFNARVVDPSTAMVSLLDHLVRSPQATSLLLGLEEDQDTIDIEVLDPVVAGMALRNLRLPSDVIVLSITRKEGMMIPHGFNRLRLHDIVTVVGSLESLEKVKLQLGEEAKAEFGSS